MFSLPKIRASYEAARPLHKTLLFCAIAAALSLAGLIAVHPLLASMQLVPLDSLSASIGKLDNPEPLPPNTLDMRLKEGAQTSNYTLKFKARISETAKQCELLKTDPGATGLSLVALPDKTLTLLGHQSGATGETELAAIPDAFKEGQWFTGSITKTWGGIATIQLEGQGGKATLASFLPPVFNQLVIGDTNSSACSIAATQVQFQSLKYREQLSPLSRYFYQLAKVLLWLILLLASLGLIAHALWLSAPPSASRGDEGMRRGELVALLLLTGFFIAVAFHYIEGCYLGKQYPFNTFLFWPENAMVDFYNPLQLAAKLNPYLTKTGAEPGLYFPLTYLPLYLLSKITVNPVLFFVTTTVPLFMALNVKYLNRAGFTGAALYKNALILSCLSYPLLFCLDRGNLEIYVFLSVATAVYLLEDGRELAGAAFLALAIAIKGYPAVFLLLFLKRGNWRAALLACGLSVALLLGPLMLYHGGFAANLAGLRNGMDFFFHRYALDAYGYSHNSSLFNLARIGDYFIYGWQDIPILLKLFNLAALLLVGATAYYVWSKEDLLWKQTALLACATLLFTPVSSDYKMIILFLPLWLFITEPKCARLDTSYAAVFALLLIPKEYPISSSAGMPQLSVAVIANPLLMLLLCALIITEGLAQPAAQEK